MSPTRGSCQLLSSAVECGSDRGRARSMFLMGDKRQGSQWQWPRLARLPSSAKGLVDQHSPVRRIRCPYSLHQADLSLKGEQWTHWCFWCLWWCWSTVESRPLPSHSEQWRETGLTLPVCAALSHRQGHSGTHLTTALTWWVQLFNFPSSAGRMAHPGKPATERGAEVGTTSRPFPGADGEKRVTETEGPRTWLQGCEPHQGTVLVASGFIFLYCQIK